MGLAGSRRAQHEQRVTVTVLRLFWRRRAFELGMKYAARIGVDRLNVERIAVVEVRAVRDRGEHLWSVAATERDRTRIDAGRRARLLKQIAQFSARRALDLGCPTGKDRLHDAHQHALVLLQRSRIPRGPLDDTCQDQATPFLRSAQSERSGIVTMRGAETQDALPPIDTVLERLVPGQRQEILRCCDLEQRSCALDLSSFDLAIGMDRETRHVEAIAEERELDQHREAELVGIIESFA